MIKVIEKKKNNMLPELTKAQNETLKILKEWRELKVKQIRDGTLCYCGATTPEEHLGVCDYCWENSFINREKIL